MPVNDGGSLPDRLKWFTGMTAYGSSAKGNTRAAYDQVCAQVIGGPLNMRRGFEGAPEPADGPTVWSSKDYSAPAVVDRRAAFTTYGRPCVDIFHHEPNPDYTDPGLWRSRAESALAGHPPNVVRAACFMGQDARDGSLRRFLPSKPAWLDVLLFDAYRDRPEGGRTPRQLFGPCVAEAERLGVPWGLGEFGVAGTAKVRLDWITKAIEYVCDNRHCLLWLNFQSNIGARAPVNYDGTKEWAIEKSTDRHTPEMAALWRDMASLMRQAAAAAGNPGIF